RSGPEPESQPQVRHGNQHRGQHLPRRDGDTGRQPGPRQLRRHRRPNGDHPVPRPLIALLLAALPAPLLAQGVLVAPHAIIIDHRTRSGSLSLYNPGSEPSEITLSTFYGYPVTDSAGEFVLRTPETPDSIAQSAAGWIEAFHKQI